MKFKITALLAMLVFALVLAAQAGSQGTPAAPNQNGNICACCNQNRPQSESGTGCNGCCKDGKCPMMSGGASGPRCPMMAEKGKVPNGKMCCSGNKCPMHAKGGQGAHCCCHHMSEPAPVGM